MKDKAATATEKADHICKGLKFEECELAILRMQVDKAEKKVKQKLVNSEDVKKILQIVENFIKSSGLVAYGGLAIDRLLPEEDKIYNKDVDLPDYDFFSPNAVVDAKRLGDIYAAQGYTEVEVKSGQHHGTFKVFVNFTPIADITLLPLELFKAIKASAKKVNGMLFADPNFLRMGMYLELSRPDGDVSRFEKVLKRLILINKHYPLGVGADSSQSCERRNFQRALDGRAAKAREGDIYDITFKALAEQGVVFFGGYAITLYSRYMPRHLRKKLARFPDFDVLATNPVDVAEYVKERLNDSGIDDVHITTRQPVGEIIPEHLEIRVGDDTIAFVYKPVACHSYNVLPIGGKGKGRGAVAPAEKTIKVATIDTMLSFYLAFLYANRPYYDKERILCMAKFLFDVQQRNRLKQWGLLKRFSINCYGHQETVEEMRAHKAEIYREMKEDKANPEYDEWFLNYRPADRRAVAVVATKRKTKTTRAKTVKHHRRTHNHRTAKKAKKGLFSW